MHALEKIDQLREPECFGGWLRSMAQRMAINRAVRRSPLLSSQPLLTVRRASPVASATTARSAEDSQPGSGDQSAEIQQVLSSRATTGQSHEI